MKVYIKQESESAQLPISRKRKRRRTGSRTVFLRSICGLLAVAVGGVLFYLGKQGDVPVKVEKPAITVTQTAENLPENCLSESSAEQKIRAYAKKNHLAFHAWPAELVDLLERNPETEDFVLGYPTHLPQKTDLSAYDRSEGVPLFLQWDPQWGYTAYGSGMLAVTGCGPACLAMVGYYLTGDERFTPDGMAAFSLAHGYYSYGNGSCWTLISEGGRQLGLDVTELPLDQSCVEQNLESGKPIICVMGPGDFTTTGHFIVLTGIRDGKLTLNDPNSKKNSERLWTYEEIQDQIENLWAIRSFA